MATTRRSPSSASKYHHSYPPGAVTACQASGTGGGVSMGTVGIGGAGRCGREPTAVAVGSTASEHVRHRRAGRRRASRRAAGSRSNFCGVDSRARPANTSYRCRSIAARMPL